MYNLHRPIDVDFQNMRIRTLTYFSLCLQDANGIAFLQIIN